MNRLYTLMGCLEGFDSGIEFDCLDIEEDQHEEDHGVEEIGGVVHDGHRNLVVDDCLLDDEEEEGSSGSEDSCLSGEVVGDGSSEEGVWYGEEEYGEEEEYIEESSEEELVVLRCDLSRVCDSIASSRVCHGSGLVELGREKKRRFGRGRVRGPRRRNTADEEAMEMDMAMARARVEDERISISTFSSG
ncbi:hypothetical protein AbraCBS73388_010994 [Aspergillus brasiliensis]|uniref:Uncharacterized protein n=1 Tax=Aspergillus brasiliensis TaxID=319629 RepID=A0A9W6DQP2_9EURO|nr:hypothetical protein AbraCBS73388_010994 [Aspergillus brasiliensis]